MSTPATAADTAILLDALAHAASVHISQGNLEAALHLTRYAVVVLPVPPRIAKAWVERDWDHATALAASDAVHAVRAMAA